MNVLSLFDGMSCGRIVLDRAGIPITSYYASEIDKYAIQVSKANWPDIIHIGDVTKVSYCNGILYTEFGNYNVGRIDLLIAGSPCQGFSFAGKQLNFEDPRSKLFFEFTRILKEIQAENPTCFFFLENVVMKKEYQSVISQELGTLPVLINSALVSAQNRKRLYWTNLPFMGQPEDQGILLRDILETDGTGFVINRSERSEKAMCIDANYHKGADNHGQRTMIEQIASETNREFGVSYHENGNIRPHKLDARKSGISEIGTICHPNNKSVTHIASHTPNILIQVGNIYPSNGMNGRIYSSEGKSPSLRANTGGLSEPKIEIKEYSERCQKQINKNSKNENQKAISLCGNANLTGSGVNILRNEFGYRKLTPIECERLQCAPDNYTNHVSASQRYRMLGNGWNVDTIVHLFEPLKYADIL